MVNNTTGFKEGQGQERKLHEWQASCRSSEETQEPKPETKCFYQGNGHWQRNCLKYLVDKKAVNFKKSIFDICVLLMCTLLVLLVAPGYQIPVQLLSVSNSKQKLRNKRRLAKGEMTICVGSISKVDQISYAPSTIEIGVCVEHRHDWIMSIAIRLFI